MYRVILADDEITSIRYLKNIIHSFLPEYEIVAEAESGLAALDALKRESADLLITDIRMPGMDGLALAKAAREMDEDLRIVIVSGYSEFEYAKGAISAAVDDYLLKPLAIDGVVEVLRAVSSRLDALYEEKRRAVFLGLLKGDAISCKWQERFLPKNLYRAALIRFGNLPLLRDNLIKSWTLPEIRLRDEVYWITGRDEREFILIGTLDEDRQSLSKYILDSPGDPSQAATVILLSSPRPPTDLHKSLAMMRKSLDDSLVIGRTQILSCPCREIKVASPLPESELRKLENAIETGNPTALKELLVTWAVEWETVSVPQLWVEAYVDQITERAILRIPGLSSRRVQLRGELGEVFFTASTFGDVTLGVWDVLFGTFTQNDTREAEAIAADIQAYICHACVEPLTLQSAASFFGISQTYLGRLLRRYAHTSFSEYLTACRMNVAKNLIDAYPDMKLKDVAHCSGYEDPSYFSKVFLKQTGMTPSQYSEKRA